MIHLTMGVLLNNFVLVKQILAMLDVVVMIMSKVKMGRVLSPRSRSLGFYVLSSYYSDFKNTCTDGQIWSDWGEWGDCNYVTRTKKRYRECLAGDPYCKGKLEGQEVIVNLNILIYFSSKPKIILGVQATSNLGRLGELVRL